MLNIITSLSPVALADDLIEKIQDYWKNPFLSPVVVFPDSKTEQWFKLHTLGRQNVLMNLQTRRLESFLFDLLKTNDNQSLLSPDLLRDLIIQKLLSTENGQCYVTRVKDADNIGNYLNLAENINYKHLFDFANDLSKLFIEYEATRENIDDAIQDEEKNWQKNLYQDIITPDGIKFNNRHYYTCPQLAEKNKQENNGKIAFKETTTPVFVFGFSGMGQTYRNLLKELGRQSDVFVYLQTTKNCKDNTNIFIKHWAQFGKKNHELFATDAHTENKTDYAKKDTFLGKIQDDITQDREVDIEFLTNKLEQNKNDDSLTITSVPSKFKELEIVHSSICKLLKHEKKNVTMKDILVLAPDISEYKTAITNVFNQVDPDDKEYPFIPISIVDYSGADSSVLDVLQTLYSVLQNGGLNRKLFFAFTKNLLIQTRYKITDSDVTNVFQQWIDSMQVYRIHGQNGADDWENAVYRLLIAKLTDNDKMSPFSDINTEDNELLAKFVKIIDDVKNNWVKTFKDKTLLNQADIVTLQLFLKDLFALDNNDNSQQFKEKFIYKKIDKKLEQYKEFDTPVPMDCIMLSLIDIASNIKFDQGEMFTRGVTFTSLMSNRILPARYVFLLGMSSNSFPGTNKKTVLDGRTILPQNGDDDIPGKNKNAFLCQLMATGDELHISFVDKDLQTNNEFYPSCVLDVLTQYTKIKTKTVGIDETRNWNELCTPGERSRKQVFLDLERSISVAENLKPDNEKPNDEDQSDNQDMDLPDTVKLTEFKNYLENPLKCYASRVFGFEEEDTSAAELEETDVGPLLKDSLNKRLVKPLLNNTTENLQWKAYKDLLPKEPFGESEFETTKNELRDYIAAFRKYNKDNFGPQEIDIKPNFPINIKLTCEYTDTENHKKSKEYTLHGEVLMCAYTDTDIILCVPKKEEKYAYKKFPEMYALVAQIAQQNQQQDKEYQVHILYDGTNKKIFQITGNTAKEKLNEFYKRAFVDQNKLHIPYFDSEIYDINTKWVKASFDKYKAKFIDTKNNHYFISHSELLNPDTALGFDEHTFETNFKDACDEHGQLLLKQKE